jgi:hypothetical protein
MIAIAGMSDRHPPVRVIVFARNHRSFSPEYAPEAWQRVVQAGLATKQIEF